MKEFKVGDTIVISGKPKKWASLLCEHDPLSTSAKLSYPFWCVIDGIKDDNDYTAMSAGGYGWCLTNLIKMNLITLSEQVIEIY